MDQASDRITINRAPVLTLWAAVVTEQLGFDRAPALTLGQAKADCELSSGRAKSSGAPGPSLAHRRPAGCYARGRRDVPVAVPDRAVLTQFAFGKAINVDPNESAVDAGEHADELLAGSRALDSAPKALALLPFHSHGPANARRRGLVPTAGGGASAGWFGAPPTTMALPLIAHVPRMSGVAAAAAVALTTRQPAARLARGIGRLRRRAPDLPCLSPCPGSIARE